MEKGRPKYFWEKWDNLEENITEKGGVYTIETELGTFKVGFDELPEGLIVTGVEIPHGKNYDPFAKIWWFLRQRFKDYPYRVDAVAHFSYDNPVEATTCVFIPNMAPVSNGSFDEAAYLSRYKCRFGPMMKGLKRVLLSFIAREDGLIAYTDAFYSDGFDRKAFDSVLSEFMRAVEVRIDEDDRHKAERNQKRKFCDELARRIGESVAALKTTHSSKNKGTSVSSVSSVSA